jgi:hypothetical protein
MNAWIVLPASIQQVMAQIRIRLVKTVVPVHTQSSTERHLDPLVMSVLKESTQKRLELYHLMCASLVERVSFPMWLVQIRSHRARVAELASTRFRLDNPPNLVACRVLLVRTLA